MRVRREVSDCFCIELAVCDVSRDEDEDVEVRLDAEPPGVVFDEDLSFATRWAVIGSKADICIGGRLTGDLGFLGSVDDKVCIEKPRCQD